MNNSIISVHFDHKNVAMSCRLSGEYLIIMIECGLFICIWEFQKQQNQEEEKKKQVKMTC